MREQLTSWLVGNKTGGVRLRADLARWQQGPV
jgi:hypothetical protein